MSQDGDIGLSTFTPAKLAFIYGQDTTSECFKDSAIFGYFNQNTNSVNISDEQSGNSGQGTSSDIGGCSINPIHDAAENLSTADGGRADIEMLEDESITSGSVASGADDQDIQTNKAKRPNKKTRNRMKRQQENAKRLLKSTVDNDQSRGVPNDTEDTNTETDGKKADSNVEIQNKGKDGMSHTNTDDKSNKDINKSSKDNNKSNRDNDNKSETEICQKGATSSQHINNENGKTKVQPDTGKEKKNTKASKTENSSQMEEQKTDKKHSSGNQESKKNCTGKSENQPDVNKNKNEANNSSKGSQSNSSGKTNDKGNACPSNKPQVLLEKSHQ